MAQLGGLGISSPILGYRIRPLNPTMIDYDNLDCNNRSGGPPDDRQKQRRSSGPPVSLMTQKQKRRSPERTAVFFCLFFSVCLDNVFLCLCRCLPVCLMRHRSGPPDRSVCVFDETEADRLIGLCVSLCGDLCVCLLLCPLLCLRLIQAGFFCLCVEIRRRSDRSGDLCFCVAF